MLLHKYIDVESSYHVLHIFTCITYITYTYTNEVRLKYKISPWELTVYIHTHTQKKMWYNYFEKKNYVKLC